MDEVIQVGEKKDVVVSEDETRSIILYRNGNDSPKVEVLFRQEMLWMSQKQIALLFDVNRPAVTKHLSNIFKEGELLEDSVCSILERTAEDRKTYKTKHYNLDVSRGRIS